MFFLNIPADSVTYDVNGLAMYKCIDWEAMMILGELWEWGGLLVSQK